MGWVCAGCKKQQRKLGIGQDSGHPQHFKASGEASLSLHPAPALPRVFTPFPFQVEDLKSQLVFKDDSQRLVEQEVQEKLREAQECSRIQKELEKEKARWASALVSAPRSRPGL